MEKKNNKLMEGKGEGGKWITVNGSHIFIEEGQSVEDAINTTFDKQPRSENKNTDAEVWNITKTLNKSGKATTKNKEVADMYRKNANPYKNFTVKETDNGYEISVENKSQTKISTTLTEDKRKK